jgi:hypothetical protein
MSIILDGTNGITGMPTIMENATASATAATGTVNYDVLTQTVLYYTTNASGNWVLNVRGNSGTTLNSVLGTGQSLSIVFMNTNGTTAYYPTSLTIDGTTVTPKWQGGIAPTFGNPNGVDMYSYAIVKTGSATYSVFASQSRFA